MMRNTILALDDWCYQRPLYCLPFNTNLFVFCVIPSVPCYPTYVMFYRGVLPSFMSRRSWEFHHLLRILDIITLLAISVHSLVPVLFLTGIPTIDLWRAASKLLATLLLEVNGRQFILRPSVIETPFWHRSYLSPYYGCFFQPMFTCVGFPRACIIIPFDLTNVISLFTWLW